MDEKPIITDVQPQPLEEEPRDIEKAVAAVLRHKRLKNAAQALGVSTVTLWRYMKRPEFHKKYLEARRHLVSHAIAGVQQTTFRAVRALCRVMDDPKAWPSARVFAAKTILDLAVKGVEIEDMEARLSALEAAEFEAEQNQRRNF